MTAAAGRFAYGCYDAAGALAALLAVPALPFLWYRGWTDGLSQRLGALPTSAGALDRPVWLHAASVGETLSAQPLIAALRRGDQEMAWLVSNTTRSGQEVAQRELAPQASTLLPIDALRIVDRAFRRVRPRALVVVETEIWPGLLRAAANVGAPVAVVSGRMSERTLARYLAFAPLFRSAMSLVDVFCMQSEADAERVSRLGVAENRIHVTGSLKAGRGSAATTALRGAAGRRLLVAASTQPGEEEFVLEACRALWQRREDVLLVLAPRRPERFDEVADLLAVRGIKHQRRSRGDGAMEASTSVLLLDTLGELAGYFPLARAAFVGGTIAPIGGHNLLEPATVGVPVSFGPSLDNVAAVARALCDAGGGVQVTSPEELAEHWARMLDAPQEAEVAGQKALSVAAERAEAVAATEARVLPLLRGAPS